jgi:hypothetical protein
VLEDCDRFPPDETALFHLINLARETGLFHRAHGATEKPDLVGHPHAGPALAPAASSLC